MIQDPLSLSAAFVMGLLGSSHCQGMCGGIMSALSVNSFKQSGQTQSAHGIAVNYGILFGYNAGRILTYVEAGVIVSLLGLWLQQLHADMGFILRIASAILLVLMGFYLTGWWMALTSLETLGSKLWRYIQPLANQLIPVKSVWHAVLLGMLWGWLPCGLVYSVLAWSATASSLYQGAGVMLFFGLGTLPSLLLTGLFAQQVTRFARQKSIRAVSGSLIIVFGLWTLYGALHMTGGEKPMHSVMKDAAAGMQSPHEHERALER